MRLFVNKKEIPSLKRALKRLACTSEIGSEDAIVAIRLYERVELSEQLQENESKSEVLDK